MRKRLALFAVTFVLLFAGFLTGLFIQKGDAEPTKKLSRLDLNLKRGEIRVGTTGDNKPFTYLIPKTKQYEGYDIDVAKMLAKDLGVKVKFVKTTWPNLMSDLQANKFDIAMGGITRTLEREKILI